MIIQMDNFLIKEKKYEEFQNWIKANEKNLDAWGKKAGIKYRGTYYYAMGTGASLNAGGCFMWELSKYGDIDTSLTTFKDPMDEKMTRELNEFFVNQPASILLLRPIGEALIYEGT
jgi:hypothetical protein